MDLQRKLKILADAAKYDASSGSEQRDSRDDHSRGRRRLAVRIQIAVALIAFLLLRLAQAAQKAVRSPLVFARLVRTNLMHRRSLDNLLEPPPAAQDQRQFSLTSPGSSPSITSSN